MKIIKFLQLLLLFSIILSCSQDAIDEQTGNTPEQKIATHQFDSSYLGLYKGLFTTENGQTRGSVEVTLSTTNEGFAKITLSSGEVIELKSSRVKLTVDNTVSNLRFSSEGLNAINAYLEFSVNGDGSQPVISNVVFDSQTSDILIAKNLARVPLTPITGTYVRTSGTGGFPNSGRTWNVMAVGEGDGQTFAVQIAYGGRVYNTPAANSTQSNCTDAGGLTTCDLNGTARILGYNIAFSGTHAYSLGSSQSCSAVSGTWSAPSFGNSVGTFNSDVDASDCVVSSPLFPEVVIGAQTWMLENLNVETYRNGDPIPQVQDPEAWANLTTGAWCYYNNDPANGAIYGKLYNKYAVDDSRGLAPQGWHVSEREEWNVLGSFLGGNNIAGGKLKSVTGWFGANVGATNESGFTALPGGIIFPDGRFVAGLTSAYFYFSDLPSVAYLDYNNATLQVTALGSEYNEKWGFSVRCVKN